MVVQDDLALLSHLLRNGDLSLVRPCLAEFGFPIRFSCRRWSQRR